MISVPTWLFIILLLIVGITLIVFISVLIGYIAYCKQCDRKKREIIEEKYGKRHEH